MDLGGKQTSAPLPRAAAGYPIRVACIDMGSNAIRFLAAEFDSETTFQKLAGERHAVRLGHGVYLSGRLDPAAMDSAVAALQRSKELIDELGIAHYRAVATSAVRESKNGDEFITRIRRETGIELQAISGSEEARLVHLAVSRHVPLGARRWLLADLGGGSVEVSLVDQDGTFWSESHTMGSVRLLEELTESGTDPGRFRRLISEYISVLKVPVEVREEGVAGFVATGGNIEALAKLGGYGLDDGVTTLSLETLRGVIEKLAAMSYHQRVTELKLREDRADVILPAAMVYLRLGELCGVPEITVPHIGIKEGVLYDMVSGLASQLDHADRQSRNVRTSALTIGRKYQFDEEHARHVADLSLALFDQLLSVHGLAPADRKILHAAALLHDIGQIVSYKGHHKHSLYLIWHSELPSFSSSEMRLVANVARYHRKSHPQPHHHDFTQLSEMDQLRTTKLAALLRLADSLDREHLQSVTGVTTRVTENEVIVWLEGTGGLLLEGWSLKKKAQLFAKVYGREIRLKPMLGEG